MATYDGDTEDLENLKLKTGDVITFNFSGETKVLHVQKGDYTLEVGGGYGGPGSAGSAGGVGGLAKGTLYVDTLATLFIHVGGNGQQSYSWYSYSAGGKNPLGVGNGGLGGHAYKYNSGRVAGGGGACSDICLNENNRNSVLIIAGGGGGGANSAGGSGGGLSGTGSGTPGTQTSGEPSGNGTKGRDGLYQRGHDGAGGGGGGYFGGIADVSNSGATGPGGSGFVSPQLSNTFLSTGGNKSGVGYVKIICERVNPLFFFIKDNNKIKYWKANAWHVLEENQ